MSQTETNCRNNNCVHFFVLRERMVEANHYFCLVGISRPSWPQYPCQRLERVVVKFDAGRSAYSSQNRHPFQPKPGQSFQSKPCHRFQSKSATRSSPNPPLESIAI